MSLTLLLERQRGQAALLLDLLQREQDALLRPASPGSDLERLAEAKQACFQQLEADERERVAMQSQLGCPAGLDGAQHAAAAQDCLALWHDLRALLERVLRLNRLNGSLIAQRMAHNRRVLDALERLRGPTLYGADGQAGALAGRFQSRA